MLRKRLIAAVSVVIVASSLIIGCGSSDTTMSKKGNDTTIAISGSTSVGPLVELEEEEFEANNQGVTIEINQTGSSSGIKDTISGTTEIGMSSRELTNEESKNLKEVTIAVDGIGVVVNKNNPVKNLTLEQIKDIFTGKITNWSEVGGEDKEIVVVSREEGSGTRTAFQEILNYSTEDTVKNAIVNNSTGATKVMVEENDNAIGYMSIGYIDDSIASVNVDGVEATADNVKSGEYKIQRPFLLVYKEGALSEEGQEFIDFILSDKGQAIVAEENLVTVD
ncbi:MAG: phosphate ABC transporter substrate-binding protein [Sarcina ventriculi]|uniref:Phosphate-binding protein n=1 Tax=Sarcina ventriculi TaxID=1267 RepID=A0ABP2API0_SARVE|nr:phosphate ABC transporter substrate-binding protein [Sarcina ventriculi]MDO4401951.1 phosphate ABC transporter substrate-binding protein [Clostridiaceae bacterium]MBU5322631.1 phosphate ABC transporter substrate-binding protein [Sarcina ventriculi]MDD7372715.1 phosphate ABC transporter substrate-binding protein [Sarcina ventriculi]MDY7062299.1 phosphate ABC transporter substrate-binding protein [Sarcina ventriculi]CUN76158.1 Phosphate-binding protein pstS precursor [Sarcina ventriculi]